jgi:ADP-ribose pyrophosphatase YjhB (NUDIX family)
MKYCTQCAAAVEFRIPPGDTLPRYVCPNCGVIHYVNPKLIVGCIAQWQGEILLCRRAIEPRLGLWTLPAGFMENGETTKQAALRETLEEACARVDIDALFALISVPAINQVNVFYRASLVDTDFCAGPESLETRLFTEADIPWDQLAFRSIARCLEIYFADRRSGAFSVHETALESTLSAPVNARPRG